MAKHRYSMSAKIRRLMAKKMKPIEIADKLNIPVARVYNVTHRDKVSAVKRTVQPPVEKKLSETPDIVNNPPYYTDGGIEVIDFIESKKLNYHLGNVVKYVARAGKKDSKLVDLKKAEWYLKRAIEQAN